MDKVIQKWLEISLAHVSSVHPVTIHLRDLVGDSKTITDSVIQSTLAFNLLIEQLSVSGMPVKPVLTISLRSYSHKIEYQLPKSMEELIDQIDPYESPSLYLVNWNPPKSIALCEELRAPLSAPWLGVNLHTYLYYREFRYGLAFNNRWEFSRAIYAEYYPEGIIIQ